MGNNTSNIRMVILILGLIALLCVALVGALALQEKGIPDAIIATLSGSVAAIGAVLVRGDLPPGNDDG